MPYNTTTVTINYNTDAMKFRNADEYQAFLQAVGYMVVYAMHNTANPTDTLASLNVDADREVTGVYYYDPQLDAVAQAVDAAKTHSASVRRPFVMGAVPHHEGDNPDVVTRYSYHS